MKRLFEQPDNTILNKNGEDLSNEFYGIVNNFIQKIGLEVNPNDLLIVMQKNINLIGAKYQFSFTAESHKKRLTSDK